MRILLAVDGSRFSDAAVDEVVSRPWPSGSELMIVSAHHLYPLAATELWGVPPDYYDEILKAARKAAEGAVERARARFAVGTALGVTCQVLAGAPARSILDLAAEWGADLIVVGSHGYGAVKRLLLGSVSHAILVHAPCSVEVVRRRGTD